MTIEFPKEKLSIEWHSIELTGLGGLEIAFRRPTWDDICQDGERLEGYIETRLQRSIEDWRGVEADGEPVPYSWERFQVFAAAAPLLLHKAHAVVNRFYLGLDASAGKNSSEPLPVS